MMAPATLLLSVWLTILTGVGVLVVLQGLTGGRLSLIVTGASMAGVLITSVLDAPVGGP